MLNEDSFPHELTNSTRSPDPRRNELPARCYEPTRLWLIFDNKCPPSQTSELAVREVPPRKPSRRGVAHATSASGIVPLTMWIKSFRKSCREHRSRFLIPTFAGLALAAGALALEVPALRLGLLFLAPALLLFALLVGGADPAPLLLRARKRPTSGRRRERALNLPHAPRRLFPRGGEILAAFLAGRAPPALPA